MTTRATCRPHAAWSSCHCRCTRARSSDGRCSLSPPGDQETQPDSDMPQSCRTLRQIWRVKRGGPTWRCSPSRAPWTGTPVACLMSICAHVRGRLRSWVRAPSRRSVALASGSTVGSRRPGKSVSEPALGTAAPRAIERGFGGAGRPQTPAIRVSRTRCWGHRLNGGSDWLSKSGAAVPGRSGLGRPSAARRGWHASRGSPAARRARCRGRAGSG